MKKNTIPKLVGLNILPALLLTVTFIFPPIILLYTVAIILCVTFNFVYTTKFRHFICFNILMTATSAICILCFSIINSVFFEVVFYEYVISELYTALILLIPLMLTFIVLRIIKLYKSRERENSALPVIGIISTLLLNCTPAVPALIFDNVLESFIISTGMLITISILNIFVTSKWYFSLMFYIAITTSYFLSFVNTTEYNLSSTASPISAFAISGGIIVTVCKLIISCKARREQKNEN